MRIETTHTIEKILKSAELAKTPGPPASCDYCCPIREGASAKFVRAGTYKRSVDNSTVQRYRCVGCGKTYSDATHSLAYKQQRRDINLRAFLSLSAVLSLRRISMHLGVSRGTLHRRLGFFEAVARQAHQDLLVRLKTAGEEFKYIQFDDVETFEHTKLKPLAIPLVVSEKERYILGVGVASMPAKGPLAALSKTKYGPRADHRPEAWRTALNLAKPFLNLQHLALTSDMHVSYPKVIKEILPAAVHIRKKSRRACVAGQGELKKGGHDPMFPLNHTAAMFRANVNRLIRKTWCTTKRPDRLLSHLWLYMLWHNVHIEVTLKMKLKRERKTSI